MSENTENKNKYQVWKIVLLPIILALIPLVYPEVKDLLARKQPQFILDAPVVKRGDEVIYIFAENNAAQKQEDLNIEIGGLDIKDAGKLVRENPLKWEFRFKEYDLPRAILGEGLNTITVSFAGGQSSPEMNFYINADFFQEAMVVGDRTIKTAESDAIPVHIPTPIPPETNDTEGVKIISTLSDDDPMVTESLDKLVDEGVQNVVGYTNRVEHIDANFKGGEIRYFNEQDKVKAERIRQALKKPEQDYKLVDYSKKLGKNKRIAESSKGQVEVWLGRGKNLNVQ